MLDQCYLICVMLWYVVQYLAQYAVQWDFGLHTYYLLYLLYKSVYSTEEKSMIFFIYVVTYNNMHVITGAVQVNKDWLRLAFWAANTPYLGSGHSCQRLKAHRGTRIPRA